MRLDPPPLRNRLAMTATMLLLCLAYANPRFAKVWEPIRECEHPSGYPVTCYTPNTDGTPDPRHTGYVNAAHLLSPGGEHGKHVYLYGKVGQDGA